MILVFIYVKVYLLEIMQLFSFAFAYVCHFIIYLYLLNICIYMKKMHLLIIFCLFFEIKTINLEHTVMLGWSILQVSVHMTTCKKCVFLSLNLDHSLYDQDFQFSFLTMEFSLGMFPIYKAPFWGIYTNYAH